MSNQSDYYHQQTTLKSRKSIGGLTRRRKYEKSRHNPLLPRQTGSLDAKVRCRSEGEILKRIADDDEDDEEADDDDDDEDEDEIIPKKNPSTYSIPITTTQNGMQYKKRLLIKYHREQQKTKSTLSIETNKSNEGETIDVKILVYFIFKIILKLLILF